MKNIGIVVMLLGAVLLICEGLNVVSVESSNLFLGLGLLFVIAGYLSYIFLAKAKK